LAVITVARQIGSGGDPIAQRVAEILGYELVDQKLVEEIASITDTSPEEVEKFDEKGEGRIKHFLKRLLVPEVSPRGFPLSSAAYFPEFGLEFPYVMDREASQSATYLDRGTYQLLITTVIQEFGQTGKAVIVGRASQVILANRDDVLHLKIVAPLERRCENLMKVRGMDLDGARELAQQHDRWRQLYLRNYHKADWDDPLLYHLTINTDKISEDEAVDLVVRYVAQRS
jgi:cytidylate kinase